MVVMSASRRDKVKMTVRRLYSSHGIQVQVVHRSRPGNIQVPHIPTVAELMSKLAERRQQVRKPYLQTRNNLESHSDEAHGKDSPLVTKITQSPRKPRQTSTPPRTVAPKPPCPRAGRAMSGRVPGPPAACRAPSPVTPRAPSPSVSVMSSPTPQGSRPSSPKECASGQSPTASPAQGDQWIKEPPSPKPPSPREKPARLLSPGGVSVVKSQSSKDQLIPRPQSLREPMKSLSSEHLSANTYPSTNEPTSPRTAQSKQPVPAETSWVMENIESGHLESATTTASAPFSSADLLGSYPGENRLPSTDELRIGNGNLTDRESRQKVSDLERRPSSRKDSKKSLSFNGYIEREKEKERERDSRDRHKDDTLTPTTHNKNYFKPMGMRNNFLSGQQIPPSQRNVPPPPLNTSDKLNREPDDLVAMGTNWNPPHGSYSSSNQRNGHRPNSYGNASGSQLSLTPSGSLAPVSGSRKAPSSYSRPSMYAQGLHNRQQAKDSEPKYSDPLPGAPPSFQQRIAELAAIEQETIRWEKARKMKKKPKDS